MGLEEQRLYEIVKLKEQFQSILKDFNKKKETQTEEVDGRKEINWKTESEYWTDTEYKSRRQRQFLLHQQKNKQASSKRKVLRVEVISTESAIEIEGKRDVQVE
jgi:hypothetical protein